LTWLSTLTPMLSQIAPGWSSKRVWRWGKGKGKAWRTAKVRETMMVWATGTVWATGMAWATEMVWATEMGVVRVSRALNETRNARTRKPMQMMTSQSLRQLLH
jgi:hypothetical protein